MQTSLRAARAPAAPSLLAQRRMGARVTVSTVVRADNRPLREFNEESGKVSTGGGGEPSKQEQPGALYADENPPPPRDVMSKEMKEKLRREYLGLGGSPNTAMGGNYFLNIILVVSLLAVLSKLFGYI